MTALLSPKSSWIWGPNQINAFNKVKEELTKNPKVLALHNPAAETKFSADASSYGIGGVFLQKVYTTWKPVVYTPSAMSLAELHYAQKEKEPLPLPGCAKIF